LRACTGPNLTPYNTKTFEVAAINSSIRCDLFPWLDINDPATCRESPCATFINNAIANSRAKGQIADDFDTSLGAYARYLALNDKAGKNGSKNRVAKRVRAFYG